MGMTNQEINEAVARKLGWKQDYYPESGRSPRLKFWFCPGHKCPDNLPNYCASIDAAWEVVDDLKREWNIHIFGGLDGKYWHCDIYDHPATAKVHISESADTAQRAICLAFLKLP